MIQPTRPRHVPVLEPAVADGGIHALLSQAAKNTPEGLAVVEGDHRITYPELERRTSEVAAGLAARVREGDVVLVQLPNWWEGLVAFHAIQQLGAVVNPVVPIYRDAELGFIVEQARPSAVVIPHRFRGFDYVEMFDRLLSGRSHRPTVVVVRPQGPLPDGFVALDDLAVDGADAQMDTDGVAASAISLLMYTSGTTGNPKGALHSAQTLANECRSIIDTFDLSGGDVFFMASPLTHITGALYGWLLPVLLQAPAVLMSIWDGREALEIVEREGCTFTVGATPFLQDLNDAYADRSRSSALRTFVCGGADVPPALVERAQTVLDACVVRTYGSTECPTYCCGRCSDPPEVAANTDGRPIGNASGRLVDVVDGVGELVITGPELFLGYLDPALNEDSFTRDGYFRSGDLASIDEAGNVMIRGRKKDIIIRKGENISAKEVEDLLYTHPSVKDVAVVAVPDERVGERACAFVVPASGTGAVSLDDIVTHMEEHRVAKQKYPEQLVLVDELPRTASGKVQKFILRDQAAGVAEGSVDRRQI